MGRCPRTNADLLGHPLIWPVDNSQLTHLAAELAVAGRWDGPIATGRAATELIPVTEVTARGRIAANVPGPGRGLLKRTPMGERQPVGSQYRGG